MAEDAVLLFEHDVELLLEDLAIEEVLHTQADPRRLVGIGGTDAPLRRAELVLAQVSLGHPVERLVVRKDQVGVGRHLEAAAVHAPPGQAVDLGEQHGGIDDDAVADHRGDVVVEHAARHQLEREALAVRGHERVTGVVAALVADDDVHLLGEEIGEPPLAFVAPLRADENGRRHVCSF